ncbi:hypothetical protein NHQ30_003003 [Ciborinia camelliae]|nr:hypothetical protein NHQ30_003003 [Ciborinia camelliae]
MFASAIVPRGVIERSEYSTTSANSSNYTNPTLLLSHSSTSSSLYTLKLSLPSTSSQPSSEPSSGSTNLTRSGISGSSLGTGGTPANIPTETVISSTMVGSKLSKETSSLTRIPSYSVSLIESFNSSPHSSTKTTPNLKTISSTAEIVSISNNSSNVTSYHKSSPSAILKVTSKTLAGNSTSKKTSSHISGVTSTGKNGLTSKTKSTSHKVHITSMTSYSMFGNQTITRASCRSTTLGKSAEHYCRM